jgi:hypothetical protein
MMCLARETMSARQNQIWRMPESVTIKEFESAPMRFHIAVMMLPLFFFKVGTDGRAAPVRSASCIDGKPCYDNFP